MLYLTIDYQKKEFIIALEAKLDFTERFSSVTWSPPARKKNKLLVRVFAGTVDLVRTYFKFDQHAYETQLAA